jgi:PAS domain S-box-containing protein
MELTGGSWGELEGWILGAVPDGLWVFDDEGVTTYANDRFARMLRRAPEELVGFSAFGAVDDTGREQLRAHLARLREHGGSGDDLECLLVRSDGSTFWAQVSHRPLIDDSGRHRGWLHRVRDHTEQRRLVRELRQRELQLAEAQSIARLGSWERGEDGVMRWSDELYEVLEADRAIAPSVDAFRARIHPEDRADLDAMITAVVDGDSSLEIDPARRTD